MKDLKKISIDISTICQLRCPECSTTKGIIRNGIIGTGYMPFAKFKNLIDANGYIETIELSNWGEIFLNPEIIKIIKYGHATNIKLTAGNGVNFNTVDDEVLEALVKYSFGYLNISIDGASQETYSQYRVGGDFKKVISNIVKLNSLKAKYNSIFPRLAWQFIIFGHNEHEIPLVKTMCNELKMTFNPRLNNSDFSPIKNRDWVKTEIGLNAVTREEYKSLYKKHYKRPCCQLWVSPQINWDGKVLGCCVNKWTSFGDVLKDGIASCIDSQLYKDTKLVLSGKSDLNNRMPCFHCPTYSQILDLPITETEIESYSKYVPMAESQ